MKTRLLIIFSILTRLFSSCSDESNTERPLPEINTSEVTEITAISATSGGTILSDGGSSVTSRGVCWSQNPSPTLSDSKTVDGAGGGTFTSLLSGLEANTTYYVRAYATNANGTAYGLSYSFKTEYNPILLTTTELSNITKVSASSGGTITSDGGGPVVTRGVCWSENPNPTTLDDKTIDGSGNGNFVSNITELSPGKTYYVRAYAINNSERTSYGNELNFTTLPNEIPEEIQLGKLSRTWNIISATLNGTLRTSDFTDFKLTISGTFNSSSPVGPYSFSIVGNRPDPSPWPVSSTWIFTNIGEEDNGSFLRNDAVPMTYVIDSNGQLTLEFICTSCDYPGSRIKQVNGTWIFSFD
jgi:hypothetical protein